MQFVYNLSDKKYFSTLNGSNLFKTGICFALILAISACASAGKSSTESNENSTANDRSMDMAADVVYTPHGRGYEYKNTQLDPADFSNWKNLNKSKIQLAIDQVGQGFVLQITGHSCSIGPREADPTRGKMGNIWYSTERAKGVYQALVQAGIPANRLSVRGVADDEPLPNISTADQRNRRVTFKIVSVSNR